jgi:hypothetical protein
MPPFDLPSPAPAPPVNPPNPAPPPSPPPVAPCRCSVTVVPNPLNLCNIPVLPLTATGTPAGGTYSWSNSDTSVVTIAGAGMVQTVTYVSTGTATVTVTYNPPGCAPCSATVTVNACKCTPHPDDGRYYVSCMRSVANLVACKCKIKTRYGKLCCEGCTTAQAFHAVYTNISNEEGEVKWAQVGYSRRRNPGTTAVIQYRKAEIKGDSYNITMDTSGAPAEGSVHEWKCELDKATGKWVYTDDGTQFATYTDAFWSHHVGTSVQWSGEILNKEDDMPGTASNKCELTECQYKTDGGSYTDGIDSVVSDDNSEWGGDKVSASAMNIWDKKPNP